VVYTKLMECAWDTLRTFSQNHKQLQGTPGAVAVLHTHSRQLEFHPHVHMCMPAAALDADKGLWRSLRKSAKGDGYLFNHKALAKVFRAKLLAQLTQAGLALPANLPKDWVVDCTSVGNGQKALVYLGRYLYRGVIAEKDILRCTNGQVTYRWRDSKTKRMVARTVRGERFLQLLLQHVLPKGFRRARNFGFMHPNSKRLIALLRLLVFKRPNTAPKQSLDAVTTPRAQWQCTCCGGLMLVVRRRILPCIDTPHGQQSKANSPQ
jgi:Putative transposase/TrwC relaxase